MKPYSDSEIQSINRSLEDGIEPQRGGIDPYDLARWLSTVDEARARIAQLEAERAASVERRAAYMGVEKVRAERDEAIALLEEARPYLVAMEDVVDDKKGEGVKPNDAMRLVGEIDRLIGGAK